MKTQVGISRRGWLSALAGAGAAVAAAPLALGQTPSFSDPMAGAPEALRAWVNRFRETVRASGNARELFNGADVAGSEAAFTVMAMGPRRPMDELGVALVSPTRFVLPNAKVAIVEMRARRLGSMGVVTSDLWIALELHGTEWKPVCLRTTEPQAVGLMNMTSAPVPLLHLQAAN